MSTPIDKIANIHAELRQGYDSGKLKSIAYRKYVLLQLGYLVKDNAKRWEDALRADLGRPAHETHLAEIGTCLSDVKTAYDNVEKWAKPEKPAFSLQWSVMRRVIHKEPKGVVLIISPFNYPVWLTLGPLISAIAAGNTVVIKPSELTPTVSGLFAELIPKYVDSSIIQVVTGGIPETSKLLELPWGHILYTGSGRVGKIIAGAAAKTLSPVSLELGGKCPVFVDESCDLELSARRILIGKVMNAGQTCVAPDYVLVPRQFQDKFIDALKTAHKQFYPDSVATPGAYSRIVSEQAFTRINGLLENTKGEVVIGGEKDQATKFIAPTIVKDVKFNDSLMTEEIFGPVLPIVPIDNVDEGISYVNSHDHPLALYAFSTNKKYVDKVFSSTESGSTNVNDTATIPVVDGLPFGGIGPSGSGYSTGKFGFDTFTHLRASFENPSWTDKIMGFRYPPYTDSKLKSMQSILLPSLPARPTGPPESSNSKISKWWLFALIGAITAVLTSKTKILKAVKATST